MQLLRRGWALSQVPVQSDTLLQRQVPKPALESAQDGVLSRSALKRHAVLMSLKKAATTDVAAAVAEAAVAAAAAEAAVAGAAAEAAVAAAACRSGCSR